MFIADLIIALVIAVLMTLFFAVLLRRRGPWGSIPLFFLVVLLGAWAAGKWIGPVGPPLIGVYWLPFVVFGLIVALFLSAAMAIPSAPERRKDPGGRSAAGEGGAVRPLDGFFWLLLVVLVFVVVAAYL